METLINKCVQTLLELPDEALDNKDTLIVSAIVKSINSFSKITVQAAAHRHKEYTEAKKADISREISKVLFYVSALTHLCDTDASQFDVDALTEMTYAMPEEHQQDVILSSMYGIRSLIDLSELLYTDGTDVDFEEEDDTPAADEMDIVAAASAPAPASIPENIPALEILEGPALTADAEPDTEPLELGGMEGDSFIEWDVDPEDIAAMLAEVYAACIVLCSLVNLDLEEVMADTRLISKF